jgi:hypothetical protein
VDHLQETKAVIIDPLDTRTWISLGIKASEPAYRRHGHAPATREFNMGVFDVITG